MMRKINTILSIILLIFVNGCAGYEPIFSSKNVKFAIEKYSIEGDKIIGNKIYSKLYNLSKRQKNSQNIRAIKILINATKNKDCDGHLHISLNLAGDYTLRLNILIMFLQLSYTYCKYCQY